MVSVAWRKHDDAAQCRHAVVLEIGRTDVDCGENAIVNLQVEQEGEEGGWVLSQ